MRTGVFVLAPAALIAAVVVACGANQRNSGFTEAPPANDGGFEASTGFTPGTTPCAGLECKIVECKDGATTTLRGKVYDPAGSNPLYNVMVYIPGGTDPEDLPPMLDSTQEEDGIACETCASVVVNPLRSALTDGKGEFVLENVPVDKDVPIVVQVGKWRRLLHVDVTKQCEENVIKDKTLRLPKNGEEGNMPQIAVTSGSLDALECLLRGIGIDDKEFVIGHDPSGHVHMFKGNEDDSFFNGMGEPASTFWNDAQQLRKYDLVLLSCEGGEENPTKGGSAPGARGSMYEYLNAGGKVFATHFHYTWFKNSPQDEFRNLAVWGSGSSASEYDINTSFPKGQQFADWLMETGGSTKPGKIKLESVTNSIKTLNEPALAWIQAPNGGAKFFSVNTPISSPPEEQCGRAVFSDVHITDDSGPSSINQCQIGPGGLNAQQKALEFLFFDLSACVTDDKVEPQPPK